MSRKAQSTVRGVILGLGEAFKAANATDHDLAAEPQNQECALLGTALVPRAISQFKIGVAGLHGDWFIFAV